MLEPTSVSDADDRLLPRLERKAARIYSWIEEHGAGDTAKAERYRVEADLYVEAAKRIRQLEGALLKNRTS